MGSRTAGDGQAQYSRPQYSSFSRMSSSSGLDDGLQPVVNLNEYRDRPSTSSLGDALAGLTARLQAKLAERSNLNTSALLG